MSMGTVLIVDDEPSVRKALARALEVEGHDVSQARTGEEALELIANRAFEIVLLDIAMPGIDGLEACRRLRSRGEDVAVIVVTARDRTEDAVSALDAGADDFVAKPFALDELLARMRAVLRRTGGTSRTRALRVGDLELDPSTLTASRGELRIDLTRTEFALLNLLMRNAGKVLSRKQIFEEVWGFDFGATSNSHEIYVGYLRRKIEGAGGARMIHTVRGEGYILRAADDDEN